MRESPAAVIAERPDTPGPAPLSTTREPVPPPTPGPVKPPATRTKVLWFIPLALAALVGGYLYVTGGQVISTDNAYIQADSVGIAADVSGKVASVQVLDNQAVTQGQVLFTLDPQPFDIAVADAQARLGAARNQVLNLKASYAKALSQIKQAESELPYYQASFHRQEQLLTVSAVSRSNYDDARHGLDNALQNVAVAKAEATAVLAQLGGKADIPVEQDPTYLQAQSAVDKARRDLAQSVVHAPFAGIITHVDALRVGAYFQPPSSGLDLVSTSQLWVAASLKETELTHVMPGQPVEVHVDTYPGEVWHGTVDSVSPASGASFSLLPAQNTTGNWVKVVQRIPVRIRLDDIDGKPVLRHGMSVEADIDTGHARGLPTLFASRAGAK